MRHYKLVILLGFILITSASGCIFWGGPGEDRANSRETPQKTLDVFKTALDARDYSTAYHCLSKGTKLRYQFAHFKLMFEYTVFGVLIKNMVVSWETEFIKYTRDGNGATLRLRHRRYATYKKDFIFVYENKGWRMDFTLARVLGMPQEDEDLLFPPQPVKELDKTKPPDPMLPKESESEKNK
jgi:hypothetical protein